MISKDRFSELLDKYLSGQATFEEEEIVERWFDEIPKAKGKLTFFDRIALRRKVKLKMFESRHVVSSPLNRFLDGMELALRYAYQKPVLSLATIFVMALSVGFLVWNGSSVPYQHTRDIARHAYSKDDRIENYTTQPRLVQLADGSSIKMQPGTSIEVGEFTSRKREILLLSGEAFFDVKRNEARPFLVYSKNVVTKVLGTSFTVNATGTDVTVEVKTGRVSVSKQVDTNTSEVILTANQKVIFDSKSDNVSKTLVDRPQSILPAEELKEMTFEDVSVNEIFQAVEKAYGVQIDFNQEIFSGCTLTTYLREGEDIYERLDIICSAIGATYQTEGTRLVIVGEGCKSDSSTKE